MSEPAFCPKCQSETIYPDGSLWVCAECTHEWNPSSSAAAEEIQDTTIKDSNGNVLQDGDAVSVIKNLTQHCL